MLYGVMVELYPRNPGEPPIFRLHSQFWETEDKAHDYIDECRRQNLPMPNKWVICFMDPRGID